MQYRICLLSYSDGRPKVLQPVVQLGLMPQWLKLGITRHLTMYAMLSGTVFSTIAPTLINVQL